MKKRVFNFSAGPSVLPLPALKKAKDEITSYEDCGMSVMEMSHRSKEFEGIMAKTEGYFREILNIPQDYEVLFIQGGASLQFAMVPMNLCIDNRPVDVINTGIWSGKAIEELERIGKPFRVAASTEAETFRRLPRLEEIRLDPNASYVHLVSNNTVAGTQWKQFPDTGNVPIVADMSSDILSKPVDVSRFGLIFAGAQKNLGPAGVAVVIIRKDLAERAPKNIPVMMQYRTYIKNKSLYNTPPTFTIYMIMRVLEWFKEEGGFPVIEKRNIQKAKALYRAIDSSAFYTCPIEKSSRSLMNVVFRVKGERAEELEKKFADEAEAAGLTNLKGHRLVGGLRASIYNAQPLKGIKALIQFMKAFEKKYA